MARRLLQYGAGNIGRSFIGQLFSRSGWEVVFVDIDDLIVDALNRYGRYRVEVRDINPQTIWVKNVRAVHGRDTERVVEEIATCDIMATAVGPGALPYIYPTVARGLVNRRQMGNGPLDIIICENLRNASEVFRSGLLQYLPADYPLDSLVGLVETSIGKMVPIMTEEQRRKDSLLVFAEAFNTLIVDKKGFKGGVPDVEGIDAKENIDAYVDRKSFIHNLGHAVTAYLGYLVNPETVYIWQAIDDEHIRKAVQGAMWESARALIADYPGEFNEENHSEYISDLIRRFGNRSLGDTIYRVGRDLPRKLSSDDRLIGALRLDLRHGIFAPYTILGTAAAMLFRGKDRDGRLFKNDRRFAEEVYPRGIDHVLREICGLDPDKEQERRLMESIKRAHQFLRRRDPTRSDWLVHYCGHAGIAPD
ncbi:MAG TPA: mannitol-1-phosphate 5-dehydrogenase [Candidatus Latescibacteria bacterium]|nr:mannitol-1-phosphate 5-dehydrogenase [Candidatus Latescibacterota bacterium]